MGMLILCAESLVGAVIWAFFHVRMDGQEMVDQVQRPGYMIAFNLLLRPTMMILALVMSFTIFGAMMWFTRETFEAAMRIATEGRLFGPVTMIVFLGILTYIHYQIALRSFSIINELPDRVMRWFGQGGEGLREGSDNDTFVAAAVGNIAHRTEGLSGRLGLAKAMDPGGKDPGGAPNANTPKPANGDGNKNTPKSDTSSVKGGDD